jgi:hypothetical protein
VILGERLGREQVKRLSLRLGGEALEHRQVVAEGLARGGRRDDHDVLAAQRARDGLGLVAVGRRKAPPAERRDEFGPELRRPGRGLSG